MEKLTFEDAVRWRLRRLYRTKRYTMNEFTKYVGIPYSTLNSFMNKKSKGINLINLHKMCNGLDISMKDFFDHKVFDNLLEDDDKN